MNPEELYNLLGRIARYQAALTLIRAGDQHRLLTRVNRNTRTDDWDVMEAHEQYERQGRFE